MTDLSQVASMIEEQGRSFQEWKGQLDSLQSRLDESELKAARPNMGSGIAASPQEHFYDVQAKRAVPVLSSGQSLAALEGHKSERPSLGRVLRGIVLGARADDANELADERKALRVGEDPAGGYTTSGILAAEWIDRLRANMVLNAAGCRTLPMDAKSLSLARVTSDPTVSWHAENANITASDPTFGAINLNAKTAVCVVKLSLELAQDSANIETILTSVLTNAMAGAIDSAGLVGVTTDAAGAPGGIFNLTDRNTVTSVGAPVAWDFVLDAVYELAADNVPMDRIGALIAHPALWKKMAKLKTGLASDNTSLSMPSEVARLPKLWTTAAPFTGGNTCSAVIGDWTDLIFGVRKDITIKVLSETLMASNLQLAIVCYARCDFAATRAASFATMEGITV